MTPKPRPTYYVYALRHVASGNLMPAAERNGWPKWVPASNMLYEQPRTFNNLNGAVLARQYWVEHDDTRAPDALEIVRFTLASPAVVEPAPKRMAQHEMLWDGDQP